VRASSSSEHLVRNTGTKRPGRWIAGTLAVGTGALLLTYYYDSRSVAHEHVVMPVVRAVADAENGHKLAVRVLSAPSWARPQDMGVDGPELKTEVS
jgi:dihydroorotate dehydrogenase